MDFKSQIRRAPRNWKTLLREFFGSQTKFNSRVSFTLPETNSKFAPENGWLEYYIVSFWGNLGLFSGPNLLLVLRSVVNYPLCCPHNEKPLCLRTPNKNCHTRLSHGEIQKQVVIVALSKTSWRTWRRWKKKVFGRIPSLQLEFRGTALNERFVFFNFVLIFFTSRIEVVWVKQHLSSFDILTKVEPESILWNVSLEYTLDLPPTR